MAPSSAILMQPCRALLTRPGGSRQRWQWHTNLPTSWVCLHWGLLQELGMWECRSCVLLWRQGPFPYPPCFIKTKLNLLREGENEEFLWPFCVSLNISRRQKPKNLPGNDCAHGWLICVFLPHMTFLPVATDIVDNFSFPRGYFAWLRS